MPQDDRDLLDVLKFELEFLNQGGYGRSVRTPWKPTSLFQDSPSCLNFNDPQRPHPCHECLLMAFVPQGAQKQDVPCHHIPLGPDGETVRDLELTLDGRDTEEALRNWLRSTIERLERQREGAAD